MPQTLPDTLVERDKAVQEILDELRAGSSVDEAFRRLLELYYRPVRQFFANRGSSPEVCLDLTQETFFRIYTGIGGFRREAGFDTWLFKIATNVFRQHLRSGAADKRAGKEVQIEAVAELPLPNPSPEDEAQRNERRRLLREALRRLPEQQRKCVVFYVQDHKYREIAVLMNLSIETVKAHLNLAKRRLRQELGPHRCPEVDALGQEDG